MFPGASAGRQYEPAFLPIPQAELRKAGRRSPAAEVLRPFPSSVGCPGPAFVRLQLQGMASDLSPNFNSVTPLADRAEGLIWVVIFSTCFPVLQCSLCWVHTTEMLKMLTYSTATLSYSRPTNSATRNKYHSLSLACWPHPQIVWMFAVGFLQRAGCQKQCCVSAALARWPPLVRGL